METVFPLLIRLSPRSGLRGRSYDLAEDDIYPLKTYIKYSRIDYLHLPYIYSQSVIQSLEVVERPSTLTRPYRVRSYELDLIEKVYKNIVQCLNTILIQRVLPLPPSETKNCCQQQTNQD